MGIKLEPFLEADVGRGVSIKNRKLACSVGLVDHGLNNAPPRVDEPEKQKRRKEGRRGGGGGGRGRRERHTVY